MVGATGDATRGPTGIVTTVSASSLSGSWTGVDRRAE